MRELIFSNLSHRDYYYFPENNILIKSQPFLLKFEKFNFDQIFQRPFTRFRTGLLDCISANVNYYFNIKYRDTRDYFNRFQLRLTIKN
jgi:hypothetical protein